MTFRIWPIDLDPSNELNNGRTLTLYDLGRYRLAQRTGLSRMTAQNGWGIAVAGTFIRFRKRVTLFQKLEMRSQIIGHDARFAVFEQSLWRGDTCCSHVLVRMAIVGPDGAVAPTEVLRAMGCDPADSPALPSWPQQMIDAETARPWPPAQ